MAGHHPWNEIRGGADRDADRRRRVEEARRDIADAERVYEQTPTELRRARTIREGPHA